MSASKCEILKSIESKLNRWDSLKSIKTIEMGGLGDDYEQAIQVIVMECLRLSLSENVVIDDYAEDELQEWVDLMEPIINELNNEWHFSGAQVGAAKNYAARVLKVGFDKCFDEVPPDRIIMAKKPKNNKPNFK